MLAYYRNEEFKTTALRPYKSPDERYTCLFEGALCNKLELRQRLEKTGIYFFTDRTEEIILELYRFCGDSFAEELRGKFAVIIFDNEPRQLIVARDRYGVRSLYYKWGGNGISVATEFAYFKPRVGGMLAELNKDLLRHYFSYGYIPEDDTYLKNVQHIPAGCLLKYDDIGGLAVTPFTDMLVIEGSNQQLVDEQLLYDVVTEGIHVRLPTDRTVGVFYTGKAEELVLAATAKQAGFEVKMFSAEFCTKRMFSEYEDCLIRRSVNADDYWHAAVAATRVMDVPLADPTAPVDYLLSELAGKYVDIILSADGADVMFGVDGKGSVGFKKRDNSLIFTEDEKEQLLKFEGELWNEINDPYLVQISDLDRILRWQTLELNTRLKGSTVLKKERLTAHYDLETSFPFLDDKILNVASFLKNNEKKSMSLFKQVFADQILKFQISKNKSANKIPLATWIRTDLYENIKGIFEQDVAQEFFNVEMLLEMLEQHRKGLRDLSSRIWAVTMFIVWLKGINSVGTI